MMGEASPVLVFSDVLVSADCRNVSDDLNQQTWKARGGLVGCGWDPEDPEGADDITAGEVTHESPGCPNDISCESNGYFSVPMMGKFDFDGDSVGDAYCVGFNPYEW